MAKYDPLGEYLKKQPVTTTQVDLTFQQIEEIIEQEMEAAAYKWQQAWDNRRGTSGQRQNSWLDAGWEVTMADLGNKKVRFQRIERKASQSDQKFTIPCAYSKGKGRDPGLIEPQDCLACEGSGWQTLKGSRGDYKTCGNCKGTGKDPVIPLIRLSDPCHICHGSGLVNKVR